MTPLTRLMRMALPLLKVRGQLRPVSLGVQALVRDAAGAILLVKPRYVPGWHFPGGGVEPGETAEQAIRRELAEEGGAELTAAPRLLGLFHNPRWTRGDHVAFYEAGSWRPCAPAWGLEIEAADFFFADSLPADTAPGVRARLAELAGAPVSPVW
jgi:ADP-ribose pyrophosphatase YjhB (NUDIX family)